MAAPTTPTREEPRTVAESKQDTEQGVSPASASGAPAPDLAAPIEQMIRHLSESYRQVTGFYPFGGTLGQPQCDAGCYSFESFGHHDDTCPNRHDKPAAEPDPRDAEIARLRGQVDELAGIRVALFGEVRQALTERDEARAAAQEPKAVAERDILAEAMVTMQGILKAADERLAGEGPAVEVVGTDV